MSIWVIGGTSGIGKAIAERSEGLVFRTGEGVDVSDYEAINLFLNDVVQSQDPLHKVFFCAGINYLQWLGQMGEQGVENQRYMIDVNLLGFINVMDQLVKLWTEGHFRQDGLTVCAISSDAAERPMRTSIGYCASKAGLDMAIKVAARELGPQNWRVFGIAPGMMMSTSEYPSNMTDYIDARVPEIRGWSREEAQLYEESQSVVTYPKRIDPTHIANLAIALADEAVTRHVNGNIFTINGGR